MSQRLGWPMYDKTTDGLKNAVLTTHWWHKRLRFQARLLRCFKIVLIWLLMH